MPATVELPLTVAAAVPKPAALVKRVIPEATTTPALLVLAPPKTVKPGPLRVKTLLPLTIPLMVKALYAETVPAATAVKLLLIVKLAFVVMAVITEPAGMPVPETVCPTTRPVVLAVVIMAVPKAPPVAVLETTPAGEKRDVAPLKLTVPEVVRGAEPMKPTAPLIVVAFAIVSEEVTLSKPPVAVSAPVPSAALLLRTKVPAERLVPPVKVFAAVSVSELFALSGVSQEDCASVPEPERMAVIVPKLPAPTREAERFVEPPVAASVPPKRFTVLVIVCVERSSVPVEVTRIAPVPKAAALPAVSFPSRTVVPPV